MLSVRLLFPKSWYHNNWEWISWNHYYDIVVIILTLFCLLSSPVEDVILRCIFLLLYSSVFSLSDHKSDKSWIFRLFYWQRSLLDETCSSSQSVLGKSHGHCMLEFHLKVNLTLCDAYTEWLESHIMQLHGTCLISKSFVDNKLTHYLIIIDFSLLRGVIGIVRRSMLCHIMVLIRLTAL